MKILPTTKINELLEEFPQLEEVLISLNPQFKKLKNPLLRKTIAKIATLQQAASIADIPPVTFINHLREAVGQKFGDKLE